MRPLQMMVILNVSSFWLLVSVLFQSIRLHSTSYWMPSGDLTNGTCDACDKQKIHIARMLDFDCTNAICKALFSVGLCKCTNGFSNKLNLNQMEIMVPARVLESRI